MATFLLCLHQAMCPHGCVADQCTKSAFPVSPTSVHPCIPLSRMSIHPSIPLSPYPSCCQVSVSSIPCVPMSIHAPFLCPPSPHLPAYTTPCSLSSISPYPAISLSLCLLIFMSLYPAPPCPVSRCPLCPSVPVFPPSLFSHGPTIPYLCVPSVPHTGVPRAPVVPTALWPVSPHVSPPLSPCPRRGQRGTPTLPPRCSTATEPPAQGAPWSRRAALGCDVAALWPLGTEPVQGEGNPRTRNGDSTSGDAPLLGTERQNAHGIEFRVVKHDGHSRKGRYSYRWCVLTPPRRWDDPLPCSVPSDGRARAVSGVRDRG